MSSNCVHFSQLRWLQKKALPHSKGKQKAVAYHLGLVHKTGQRVKAHDPSGETRRKAGNCRLALKGLNAFWASLR